MRLVLLSPDYPPRRSGLADHTQRLAESLYRFGHCEVLVLTTRHPVLGAGEPEASARTSAMTESVRVRRVIEQWGWRGIAVLAREIARASPDWVLVQYVPHAYGRGGVNVAFPLALIRERLAGRRLVLLVHELYVDFPDSLASPRALTSATLALVQRAMFGLAARAAHGIAVSIEPWMQRLHRTWFLRRSQARVFHLPSPSNIEPVPTDRERVRQQLGIREGEIVLAFFGTLHVSKKRTWLLQSLRALLERGLAARLLLIGAESEHLLALAEEPVRERILAVGYVDAATASHYLQASDLFLLPTSDGVSTRRSSLMAALSHGLPVVGTCGHLTDEPLRRADALRLAPVDDQEAFLAHVITLAEDAEQRRQLAERGRALYREHYDWPSIVGRLLAFLRDAD
ncbi:N-acetyl-alpha-D-glucosaminyl L-malate synthase [bacterium HR08]|nr:N-acetyl-alpha-D-glucosaminyl L-malate synthase [bacterium HR08]